MIDEEWNLFCAENDLASAFVDMMQEAQNAENPREKIKRDVLNILRFLDQGPMEDPCDEQWNQFVRGFKGAQWWPLMMQHLREIRAAKGRILNRDLSWLDWYDDSI